MRCLLLFIFLVAIATAYALPPPPPPDAPGIGTIPTGNPGNGGTGGPFVSLLYPAANSTTNINVTFMHNITGSVNCTISIDDIVKRTNHRGVQANRWISDTSFTPFDEDDYVFAVNCTNGTWSGVARREVVVDNSTFELGGLDIGPRRAYPGQRITIEGESDAQTTIHFTITNPALSVVRINVTSNREGIFRTTYTLPSDARTGTYRVVAYPASDPNATLGGTFTVITRNPTITIVGNRTNVTQGTAISVYGQEFLANDVVQLSLIGGGTTHRNSTMANSRGEFSFNYPGTLAVGSYVLSAHSGNDSTIAATLNLAVQAGLPALPPTPTPTQNPTTTPRAEIPPEEQTTTVPSPPVTTSPVIEQPSTIPPPSYDEPIEIPVEPDGGSWWMWVLIPMILVVAIGGVGAYLVSNGTLDVSSMDAFKESLQAMLGGSAQHKADDDVFSRLQSGVAPGAPMDPGEMQTIKEFIRGERAKGFDDLTIRSALVAKGWDKREVDHVFDEVYRGQ